MDEKSAYQLLLEMTPENRKSDIEKIFRKYRQIEDENDGLFQIILVMGIYQNFFRNIPEQFQQAVNDFHLNANSEIKAMAKITKINANIEKQFRFLTLTLYAGIFIITALIAGIFFVSSFTNTTDDKSMAPTELSVLPPASENPGKSIPKIQKVYNTYLDRETQNE